jgi:methyl-accepting chemotaxis protein
MHGSDQTTGADENDSELVEPGSAMRRSRSARAAARVDQMNAGDAGARIAGDVRADLLRRTEVLDQEVAGLKELAVAFERWHQDMISLVAENRDMHSKGEDLASIVKQLIMLSLNAAIEAARAGDSARGFVVVAAEVRNLAQRAQTLSRDLGRNLHRNDLMTTATFQDIQAGGKLMMAALSGLDSMVKQLRSKID